MGRETRWMLAVLAAGLVLWFAVALDVRAADDGEGGPSAGERAEETARREVAYLGVTAEPLGETLRAQLDLPEGVGLSVAYVVPESPADEAGLKRHDVLYKLDDQLLVSVYQSKVLVRMHGPGGEATFEVIRRGKPKSVGVTFGSRMVSAEASRLTPPSVAAGPPATNGQQLGAWSGERRWGEAPRRAVTISTRQMSFTDGEHKLVVREDQQGRYLRAVNREGDVLYEGYLGEGIKDQLSATLQRKLDRLEQIQRRYPVSQQSIAAPAGESADSSAGGEPDPAPTAE